MDPGLIGFAAIVSVPAALLFYVMGIVLRKQWHKTRELEKAAERPGRRRQLERLLSRVEAQELTLEESMQRLEERTGELDRASDEHGRRLENLEAVVVGQVWNAADWPAATLPHDSADTPPDDTRSTARKSTKKLNRTRTARLARRVDR
jgi:hypothetical protein